MIKIYNTVIDETEIKGVGPLYTKRPADPTIAQMYGERAFYFEIYTKAYHFLIITDWLVFKGKEVAEADKEYRLITEAHKALRRAVITENFTELLIYEE